MATLNTLRTRGALILTIVIGVALIAFLLGDLTSLNNVFQSRRNRVGSINGNNIDYMEFVTARDNLENVMQTMYGNSLSAAQVDQLQDMVWTSLLRQYSYEPGYNQLGLSVGETEQIDMVQGDYPSPVIASLFGSPTTGALDPNILAGFIASLEQDNSGQMSALWQYAKYEMTSERKVSKYVALARGGAFVNDLEAARGVTGVNNAYNGKFAMLPFSGIADSLVEVSSSEVTDYYRKHKNNYRQSATRDIEYVLFELAPSDADYTEAAEHVAGVATEFAAAEDPMQYAAANSHTRIDPTYYTEAQLMGDQLAIAFGDRKGEMAGPTLSGNVYTMSRVAGERMVPDSVGARHILLPATSAASADSLVRAIKGGADIFALAPVYSIDDMVDLGRFVPEMMVEPFAEAVIAARSGDVFSVTTQYGTHVVQMTYKGPQVRKVQIATITYDVEPSSATELAVYNKVSDFIIAAAGSKEKFDEAVASTGADSRVATIGDRDRQVAGLANSRGLVQWSFNSKPGTVSQIIDVESGHVVAVLTGAKEAGIADVRDAALQIIPRLRIDKKAAMLTQQMAGKSLDEIAAMDGAKTGDLAGLHTNLFYEQSLGFEPAVIGAFESVAAGSASKPIKGNTGVYMIAVDSIDTAENTTDAGERVRLEADNESSFTQRLMQTLTEGSDIKDYRAKFF